MELNSEKIIKEANRLGWSMSELARRSGMKSRQLAHYLLDKKSIKGAERFARALDLDPKDLLK